MNSKIFKLINENLDKTFNLPKYNDLVITPDSVVTDLPFTPAKLIKFRDSLCNELQFEEIDLNGTITEVVAELDKRYMHRFFGEIWQPSTDKHTYSGWSIVDRINKQNPKAVLDFGCGYNPFKNRINNLTGIDPFNDQADFMVDILDFKVEPNSFDHIIVFGSLNFGELEDIKFRFKSLVNLLAPNGKMYFRANPGHQWPNGPYVDIFPWSFEVAYNLANEHGLKLDKFKKDTGNRIYFEMENV